VPTALRDATRPPVDADGAPVANLAAKADRGEDVDLGLFGLLGEDGAA
jgi:hypothetical protein